MSTRPRERTFLRSVRNHRFVFGLLAVSVLIAATAVPGFAAKPPAGKTFGMEVTTPGPSESPPGTSHTAESTSAEPKANATFYAKITNTTPGNSNPNSFTITAPSGFTITDADIFASSNANLGHSVTLSLDGTHVDVTDIDPLKSFASTGQYLTMSITAELPLLGECGTSSPYLWTAVLFTGNSLGGDSFAQNTGDSTTLLNLTCGLQFNPGPLDTTVGTDVDIRVEAVTGGSPAPFSGTITVEVTPALTITPASSQPADTSGGADFTLNGTTTGTYEVTASASDTSLGTVSASFQLYEGDLDCGNTVSDGPTDVYRGPNKVVEDCVLVPYTLTTTFTATEQSVEFLWDTGSQPNAQYKFVVPWPASTDDNPTYAENQTFYNVGAGDKALLFCDGMASSQDSGDVTFPVGTLTAGVDASVTTLTVASGSETPPAAPFDVFIDNEWMRVTAIVGTNWSVQRGYGGTTAAAHSAGSDNVLLALPIYPNGEQACLSNTTTVGITGTGGLQTQTTEEIWLKGDIKVFR